MLLLTKRPYTLDDASRIQAGMTAGEVEALVGKPYRPLHIDPLCVFVPILNVRANGERMVDAIGVVPSASLYGPGLSGYILHSPQEQFPTRFGQHTGHYELRLANELSLVVFYDQADRVSEVFALPTTIQPGDLIERVRWLLKTHVGW